MSNAIYVRETGGPEKLLWESHDPGAPGPGQVRVKLEAAGLNFIDVYFRSGQYPRPLPFILGLEGAGVIDALGPDAAGFAEGDRVAWAAVPGAYAESLLAPTAALIPIPEDVDSDVAAAAMLQGMTSHYLMTASYPVAAGDTALVHAAAGGVGLLLIQMLKAAGATVIGTCSTEDKEKLARGAGADHVVRYDQTDFAPRVREITDGQGVDVVYDSVGPRTFVATTCARDSSSGPST